MGTGDFANMTTEHNEEDLLRLSMPTAKHEEADASSVDATLTITNCRCMYVDISGKVKFDYTDDADGSTNTETAQLNAGQFYPIRNVTKVYNTVTTAQYYNSAGTGGKRSKGQIVNGKNF